MVEYNKEQALTELFSAFEVSEEKQTKVRKAISDGEYKYELTYKGSSVGFTDNVSFVQLTKTRFALHGILKPLGLIGFLNVIYIEMDTSRSKYLINYVKAHHPSRFNMFEFEEYPNCFIAFD